MSLGEGLGIGLTVLAVVVALGVAFYQRRNGRRFHDMVANGLNTIASILSPEGRGAGHDSTSDIELGDRGPRVQQAGHGTPTPPPPVGASPSIRVGSRTEDGNEDVGGIASDA
jgi:hypothetical protein